MNPPDLQALQRGDEAAWDAAFRWLWPTAFAVAQLKLQPFLPEEIEDMARVLAQARACGSEQAMR